MKKILSLVLALVLVLGSMPLAFADDHMMTPGEKLKSYGILDGNDEGDLMEDKELTRAEMIKTLIVLKGEQDLASAYPADEDNFDDVDEDVWYASWVNYAKADGLTEGVGNNMFNPKEKVDGQMVATFLLRALGEEPEWETAIADAAEKGIIDNQGGDFVRANAFDMIVDTLDAPVKGEDVKLGAKLEIEEYMEPAEPEVKDVTISSAVALNSTVVEVALDSDLDAPEKVDASIFTVMDEDDADVAIESVEFAGWDADNYTVLVHLDEAVEAGSAYTIASGDSEVDFGGMTADETDPGIDDVTSSDYNEVEITMTEAFDISDVMVTITEKYGDQDELDVLDMEYSGNDKLVVTTEEQADATLYEVEVDGLADLAGNSVDDLTDTFTGQEMDTADQEVIDAEAQDSVTVDVEFRTKVDKDAALDAANYTITEKYGDEDEVVVESVEMKLDADDAVVEEKVVLTLASNTEDATLYNLAVENVGTLYGEGLDSDNDEVSFTGKGEDTDEPSEVSADAVNNTEVKITVTDDSYIAEDVDAGLFSIAEKYGDQDELAVIAVKEVDTEAKTITLTTAEQAGATLYEVTVAEGLADKFGNVTTDELTTTFTGADVADEITSVTATNTEKGKVKVEFDKNYGDGALNVVNYKIDGDIGYPTKVEEGDADDEVILTVSELEVGTVYELTVNNVDNSDGVAMDSDGVTDKFAGKYGSTDAKAVLDAVVATDNQTIKLYFDKAVEDIDGIVEGADLDGDEFDLNYEGGASAVDLDGDSYSYVDPSNEKVLIVTADSAKTFDNSDGDEITLVVDGNEVDVDTDDDANEVVFAENTSTPDDIVVEGVVALDDQTLKVYFNQPVRFVDNAENGTGTPATDFAKVTGDFNGDGTETDVSFNQTYSNNDEMTEWTFVLASPMTPDTDSKLDFVVADGTGGTSISTHLEGTTKVAYSTETGDDSVEFSKNTESTDYIDNIGVVMTDSKTIKVIYPENMDTNDVISSANYDFEIDGDTTLGENPDGQPGIEQIVWDEDENTAYLTLNDTFNNTTTYSKLYLEFVSKNIENKAGNKAVKTDDDAVLLKEFSVSTKDADKLAISDVAVQIDDGDASDDIIITLDQPLVTGHGMDDKTEFLADFDVFIAGEKLTADDITGITVNDSENDVNEDAAKVSNDASTIEIELADLFVGTDNDVEITNNDSVEVSISDDGTDPTLIGDFNKEGLDNDSEAVASVVDADTDSAVPTVTTVATYKDTNSNGTLDTIEIVLDESIDASTVAMSDFTFSATDKLTSTANATVALEETNVANDTIVITLDESETAAGTASTDEIAYAAGAFTDLNGNDIGDRDAATMSDGAAPVITQAVNDDTTFNTDDVITFSFSEAINPESDEDAIGNFTANTDGTGTLKADANAADDNVATVAIDDADWANDDSIAVSNIVDAADNELNEDADTVTFTDVSDASSVSNNTID